MGSSSLTRDGTQVPCIGNSESQLLVHQGSPWDPLLKIPKSISRQFLSSFFQGNPTRSKAEESGTADMCPQHLALGLMHSWSRQGFDSSEEAGDLNPKGRGKTSKGGKQT